MSRERLVYLDYLRVFSAFAIIVLHVAGQNWNKVDVNSGTWIVFEIFDSIVQWGVPIFFMISGTLFLDKDISIKKIYSKYVLRLLVSFCVWSIVYVALSDQALSWCDRLSEFISGHYHMWFILVLMGLYMCIPFLRPIVQSKKTTIYFLVLALIVSFIIPEINTILKDFGNEQITNIFEMITRIINNLGIVSWYAGYFVLGYVLNRINISKKVRFILYSVGVLGALFTIIMTLIVSIKTQTASNSYYIWFNVNIMIQAIAVFVFFKYKEYKSEKVNAIIQKLSKYSYGVYLIHLIFLEKLDTIFGINTLSFNPILSVVLISVIVYAISLIISAILNNIPIINRYIV